MKTNLIKIEKMDYKSPFEILDELAKKNMTNIQDMIPMQNLIVIAMRTYGRQEYMKGFEDGKKQSNSEYPQYGTKVNPNKDICQYCKKNEKYVVLKCCEQCAQE